MLYMVEYAMLEREAPSSVEASFDYARAAIAKVNPDREPFMIDRIPGNFALGSPLRGLGSDEVHSQPSGDGVSGSSAGSNSGAANGGSSGDAEPSGSSRGPVMVCDGVKFGCPSS
jgi:hypothetical protein